MPVGVGRGPSSESDGPNTSRCWQRPNTSRSRWWANPGRSRKWAGFALERIGAVLDLCAVADPVTVGIGSVGVGAIRFRLVDVEEPVTVGIRSRPRRLSRERIGAQVDLFTVAGPVAIRVGDIRIRLIDACLVFVEEPIAIAIGLCKRGPDRTEEKHCGKCSAPHDAQTRAWYSGETSPARRWLVAELGGHLIPGYPRAPEIAYLDRVRSPLQNRQEEVYAWPTDADADVDRMSHRVIRRLVGRGHTGGA